MDSCLLLRSSSRRRDVRSSSSSPFSRRGRRPRPRRRCSVVLVTAAEVASTTPPFRPDRGLSGSRMLSEGSYQEWKGVRFTKVRRAMHCHSLHVALVTFLGCPEVATGRGRREQEESRTITRGKGGRSGKGGGMGGRQTFMFCADATPYVCAHVLYHANTSLKHGERSSH